MSAHNIYHISKLPAFQAIDPTRATQGRYTLDIRNPQNMARSLGLSDRDTERFVEWARSIPEWTHYVSDTNRPEK